MTEYPSTPETPVGATALANLGESWRILANLGKKTVGLGESWRIFVGKMAWHSRSRGQYWHVAVCLGPGNKTTGTAIEAKKSILRQEEIYHVFSIAILIPVHIIEWPLGNRVTWDAVNLCRYCHNAGQSCSELGSTFDPLGWLSQEPSILWSHSWSSSRNFNYCSKIWGGRRVLKSRVLVPVVSSLCGRWPSERGITADKPWARNGPMQ